MKKNYLLLICTLFFFSTHPLFSQSIPVAGLGSAVTLESSRNEGIQVSTSASLQWGTSSFTIEAWIKRSSGIGFFTLAAKQNAGGGTGWFLRFNDNHLSFAAVGAVTNYVDGTTDITDNNWHHIAAVMNATAKTLTLYIDGTIEKTASYTTTANVSNLQQAGIGYKPGYGEYFNGSMDDIRIWKTARTATEIKEYMNTPLNGTEANLVLYYNLEEGTGTTATDRSIFGNNGTIINTDGDEWITGNIAYNASLNEDSFLSLRLGGSDADDQTSATAYITQLPLHGKLYQTNDGITKGSEITTTGVALTDGGGNPRRVIYEPLADYNGTDNFQYKVNDGSNNSANAVTVNLTVLPMPEPGLWTGATSPDFNVAANWDDNAVPASSTDITIPTGVGNMPVLSATTSVKNITLQTGTTLSLNGQALTVAGDISVNGTAVFIGNASSSLVLNGTGASSLTFDQSVDGGSNAVGSLTINATGATITLNGKLNIYSLLTLTAGNFNINGNNVVLKSTSISNTAMIAPVSGTITYGSGGRFAVERYIPLGKRAYRLLSPGVSGSSNSSVISTIYQNWQNNGTFSAGIGTHITGNGTNGTDVTATTQNSMFTYSPGALNYTAVTNTNDTLSAIKGYRVFIRGDRTPANLMLNNNSGPGTPNIDMNTATTLSASGRIISGTIVFNSTATTISGADGWQWEKSNAPLTTNTGTDDSYSLIPNPYAAMVDWNSVTLNNISTTYYVWDPNKNLRGGYESYNRAGGIASSANVSRYIQPGQSFFVQTTGASPSLTITESDKNTSSANLLNAFKTSAVYPRLDIVLEYKSRPGIIADNCIVIYDNSFHDAINAEDSYKLENPDDNISILRNNIALGIEGRVAVSSYDTVPLKLNGLQTDSAYLVKVTAENFNLPPGYAVYLEDLYTNTSVALVMGGTISRQFTKLSDSTSFFKRFRIVFRPMGTLPLDITQVNAYEKGNGNNVEWINPNESNIRDYVVERSTNGTAFDAMAIVDVKSNNNTVANYHWYDATPAEVSYYRIRTTGVTGAIKLTPVVRVSRKKSGAGIRVFPNPANGKYVTLQLNGLEKASYILRVVNMNGNTVMQQLIQHGGGSASQVLLLNDLARGIYRIELIGDQLTFEQKLVLL